MTFLPKDEEEEEDGVEESEGEVGGDAETFENVIGCEDVEIVTDFGEDVGNGIGPVCAVETGKATVVGPVAVDVVVAAAVVIMGEETVKLGETS